jgi:flagellar hook-length control protein FliK
MSTQVHHLAPATVRRSIPSPKPPSPHPTDNFEQHLNDARSKPEPKPEPRTEAKKPAPASKTSKPKPARPQDDQAEPIAAEAPAQTAEATPTDAKPTATTGDGADAQTPENAADPDSAPDAETEATLTGDADLAQLAAAAALPAQPVAQPAATDVDPDAAPDPEATDAIAPTAARANPVGSPAPDGASEELPLAESPSLATPQEQAAGGSAEQPGPDDQNPHPDNIPAPTAKKSAVSPLGGDPEATDAPKETAAQTSDPATAPSDPAATPHDVQLPETAAKLDTAAPSATDALSNPAGLAQPADTAAPASKPQPAASPLPPAPPEVRFAEDNHDQIVTSVRTQLLPQGGGSMQIRLDPPELGALKVSIEMANGQMTATFQTSNEEATKLLSHSLNQLKHVLESQGVTVDRLQVQQAPKSDNQPNSGNPDDNARQQPRDHADDHASRQEQQRKEALQRMWRKVSGLSDPIDYLA